MQKRKTCVVAGIRAVYGLLRWVMREIQKSTSLERKVIANGMYLAPEFGLTYREIEADSFRINRKIGMLLSANIPSAITSQICVDHCGKALTQVGSGLILMKCL